MFLETLRDITGRLGDVECVLLMGTDGLPIEKVIRNKDLNIELLLAEFTSIIRTTVQTATEVEAGALDELMLLTDTLVLLLKAITPEYYILMILPQGTNIGRARFELKKARYDLEKEFL